MSISKQEFNVLGKTLTVSEGRARYNKYRKLFTDMSEELSEKYFKVYLKDVEDIDGLHKAGHQKGLLCIFEAITRSIDILVEHKIYDIDEEVFFNEYFCNYCTWDKVFDEFDDRYMSIVCSAEEMREYREARKDARGRFIGGGFGVSGAIKGSIQAGAMNLATGAAHSLLNFFENKATEKRVRQEKEALMEDPRVYLTLTAGIRENVFNVLYALYDIIGQLDGAEWEIVGAREEERVNVLLGNLSRVKDIEGKCDLLFQCLELNPYNPNIYEKIFEESSLPVGEVGKLCEFFCLDVKKLFGPQFKKDLDKCENTERGVMDCIEKINEKMKMYGITDTVFIDDAYRKLENVFAKQYKQDTAKISNNEKLREYQENMYQKLESYQQERKMFAEKLMQNIEKDLRIYDGFEYPTKEIRMEVEQNDIETLERFKDIANLSDEQIDTMYNELSKAAISGSCKKRCMDVVEKLYDGKLKEESIEIGSLDMDAALALKERIQKGKYSKGCKGKYTKEIEERIKELENIAGKEKMNQLLSAIDFNDLNAVNKVLNQILDKGTYDGNDDDALTQLVESQFLHVKERYEPQVRDFDLEMMDFIRLKGVYGHNSKDYENLREFYKVCYKKNADFKFLEDEVPLIYYPGPEHTAYMITNKRAMVNNQFFDLDDSLYMIWYDVHNSFGVFNGKKSMRFTLEHYIPKAEFKKDIDRMKKYKCDGEKENVYIAKKYTEFFRTVCSVGGTGTKEALLKEKSVDVKKNEEPVIDVNQEIKKAEQIKEVQSQNEKPSDREEEYKELRLLVEPILPTIEDHVAEIKEEFSSCRVMMWDGEAQVIQGEKAPILAVLHDTNCSPQLMGEKAITRSLVTGILPDYFYLINKEKFILYVKGVKYEWRIPSIHELSYKSGFLSFSLLVTDRNGMQKKITIHESFQKHIWGLNQILSFLRDGNKSVSGGAVALPKSEVTQREAIPQIAPVQPSEEKKETTPVQAGTEPNEVVSLTDIKHSFSEMIDYVNKFPDLRKGTFMGTLNQKFSKKVKNAVKAYADSVREEDVFALYDDTLLGSGKEGFVMTMQGLIIKTSMNSTFKCAYSDITGLKVINKVSAKLIGLSVDTKFGRAQITGWLGEEGSKDLAKRINDIVMYLYGLESVPYPVGSESI